MKGFLVIDVFVNIQYVSAVFFICKSLHQYLFKSKLPIII